MSTSDRVIASSHPDINASTTEAEVLEMARQLSLEAAQQDALRRSLRRPWMEEAATVTAAEATPTQSEHVEGETQTF